jgi:hypothetical protein
MASEIPSGEPEVVAAGANFLRTESVLLSRCALCQRVAVVAGVAWFCGGGGFFVVAGVGGLGPPRGSGDPPHEPHPNGVILRVPFTGLSRVANG